MSRIGRDLFAAWRSGILCVLTLLSHSLATGSPVEVAAMGERASQASSGVTRRTRGCCYWHIRLAAGPSDVGPMTVRFGDSGFEQLQEDHFEGRARVLVDAELQAVLVHVVGEALIPSGSPGPRRGYRCRHAVFRGSSR